MIQRLGSGLVRHGTSTLESILSTLIPIVGNVMANVRDFGAKCDGVTDDSAAIQAALDSKKTLLFPADVTIKLNSTVKPARDSILVGFNTKLLGADNITIFELPRFNGVVTGTEISGFHFLGDNCVGISVSSAGLGDGQGYYRYIPRMHVRHCEFYGELNYGMTANFIFLHASHCSFGYLLSPGKTKRIKGIRSHFTQTEANNTNFNLIEFCYFYGSSDGINARGGSHWVIRMCDFEQGGQCMTFDLINSVKVTECWMESCTGTNGVIRVTNCLGSAIVDFCMLYRAAGTDGSMVSFDAATVNLLSMTNCRGEGQGASPILNSNQAGTSQAIKLPTQGNVIYADNYFEGTIAAGAYVNSFNYRGKGTVRAQTRLNYAAGTVTSTTVPVTISKQAVGSYIITYTNNLGTDSISKLGITVTAYDCYVRVASTSNANEVLVNTYKGDTHALFDSNDVCVVIT